MQYKKYQIKTTTQAEDFVVSLLEDLGISGAVIEDNVPLTEQDMASMFIDFPPEQGEDRGEALVTFYTEPGDREEEAVLSERIRDGLKQLSENGVPVGEGAITVSMTEDADWLNNWKEFFHSFYIGDMLIHPTWEETVNEKGGITISIDPGISFGTGKHETTQLCIRALSETVRNGDSVLDLGCGSGILSIAAQKLGAAKICGTDIDPDCILSVKENFARNDVPFCEADFPVGNLITDAAIQERFQHEEFDVVAANILADVIIPMAKEIPPCLRAGGILIASGIIDTKESDVLTAIRGAGMEILSVRHQGEWVGVIAQKP